MKKKILAIILAIAIQAPAFAGSYIDKQLKEAKKNQKYNTTQKYKKTNTDIVIPAKTNIQIKDPGIIKLSDCPQVDENAYKAKIAQDEAIYKNKIYNVMYKKDTTTLNVQPYALDFYNIYRIAERIIRANNLDYINWRISVRKSDDWNAYATGVNSINIYTTLYDSLYGNDDALAYIIGHEMSHILLGHQQRSAEMLDKLNRSYKMARVSSAAGQGVGAISMLAQEKKYLAESRKMEYMADTLGAELMTRAGYNMENGMLAIKQMEAQAHVNNLYNKINSSHPMPEEREASLRENMAIFSPEWVNEGKENIMNSDVLEVKKSSDRVSIVISSNPKATKIFELEPVDKKILRIAYMNYKNGKMQNAIKYFKKLNKVKPSYVNYLYMSYANEYLYKQTKEEKYLKQAKKDANEAALMNIRDEIVIEQVNSL